jgi:MFS transporter, DHA2 family, multidrug resistance protein
VTTLCQHERDSGLLGRRRSLAIACVLAAVVLVVLDASIVNVALPAIARSLRVTPAQSVRVVSAYQIALVMALLPCAALGQRLGYRRVYAAGVALFVGASALCACAPSLSLLVVARFVQGLGGAAIMSLGIALLRFVVPQRELGSAIGWNTLAVALSSAAGPTLGALVLSSASWPWLFAVNLPLGALVLLATRALPHVPGDARKVAIIPLDFLREGSFRVSVIASVCCFVGQSAALVALPFYLQHGLGLDVLRTGLLITPWPLTVAVVAPIAGRRAHRSSGAWLCTLGGALLALGLASAALLPLHGRPFALIPSVVLCGAGFGLFQVSNNRNMFLSTPRSRSGAAGGMQGTARLTGQSLGAALMTLLFTLTSIELAPRIGLGIAAVLTLLAGLVSTLRAGDRVKPLGEPSGDERNRTSDLARMKRPL